MGKWRKRRFGKGKFNAKNVTGKTWNWKDRKDLAAYLDDYRQRAEFFAENGWLSDLPFPEVKDIGGIRFPALTNEVVRKAYLMLPTSLTSKQRKIAYESCLEVGLFHHKTGESRDDRIVLVSIYVDGFEQVAGLDTPQPWGLHRFKPWYCRNAGEEFAGVSNNIDLKSISKDTQDSDARRAMDRLFDQPGECLRDKIDVLDFEKLHEESLSVLEPPSIEDQTWVLIDSKEKLEKCIAELNETRPSEIAFDLEAYNLSKYAQITCLLQLASNLGKEYVIDTLAPGVWDAVPGLAPLFADPSIVKIGHSIGGLDARSLHRDFGIFIVNAFDTYEAARVLSLPSHGLASVCQYYGLKHCEEYFKLKEKYQACDWRVRPLTEPMIQYGRYDIRFLCKLRCLMMRDLCQNELYLKNQIQRENEANLVRDALLETLRQYEEEDGLSADGEDAVPSDDTESMHDSCEENASMEFRNSKLSEKVESEDDVFYTPKERQSAAASESCSVNDDAGTILVANADILRLQPRLMRAISRSQERCRQLWSGGAERHFKDHFFIDLFDRSKRGDVEWSETNTQLYVELVRWRDTTASEYECLPAFVAPLNFLAAVAWKRPTTVTCLRRIAFQLPDMLEEMPSLVQNMLNIVMDSFLLEGVIPPVNREYYYHKGIAGKRQKKVDVQQWKMGAAWKVAIAVGVVVGAAFIVIGAKRRRKW